jgi:hypothetical protein
MGFNSAFKGLKYQKNTMGIKVLKPILVYYNTKNALWDITISKAAMGYYNTKKWNITVQITPWNITIPRIPWHTRISKNITEY